jgi:hypothetical protein
MPPKQTRLPRGNRRSVAGVPALQPLQFAAHPDWTNLEVYIENSESQMTRIEIRVMTNRGDGLHMNFDRLVYGNDFLQGIPGVPATPLPSPLLEAACVLPCVGSQNLIQAAQARC